MINYVRFTFAADRARLQIAIVDVEGSERRDGPWHRLSVDELPDLSPESILDCIASGENVMRAKELVS